MPLTDAQLADDYRALQTAAGFVDLTSHRGRVELTGADRHAFLHNFCTNDIRNLPEGGRCEAFLLNAKGTVLFYVDVRRGPESLVVEAGEGRAAALVKHLDRYVIREQVTIVDRTAEWGELLVAGPQAAAALAGLPDSCSALPTAWTRGENFTVVGPTAAIDELRGRLLAAGVRPCEFAALNALRIEARYPLDGVDVDDRNLAQEVDRNDRTLHFRKGCYLGQETVARLDALGHVNKTLVVVRFAASGNELPQAGAELTRNGQAVGRVTSAAFSPGCGAVVALAYVKVGADAPGTALESARGPVEVVAPPAASPP